MTENSGGSNGGLEIFGEIVLDPEFSESILKQKNESKGVIHHAMRLCTEALGSFSGKPSLKVDINSNRLSLRLRIAPKLENYEDIDRGMHAVSRALIYLLNESIRYALANGLDAYFPKVKEISVKKI